VAQAIKSFLVWDVADNGGQAYIKELNFRDVTNHKLTVGDIPVPTALRAVIQKTVNDLTTGS